MILESSIFCWRQVKFRKLQLSLIAILSVIFLSLIHMILG